MKDLITFNGVQIPILEYRKQRVVTLAMIDQVHRRLDGTARKRFNDNRNRFKEGKHFFELSTSEIRKYFPETKSEIRTYFRVGQGGKLILITESGYLLLVKSFTDDLAWEVQDQLVDSYFRSRKIIENLQFELHRARGHVDQMERHWFGRFPHWRTIRDEYLCGTSFKDISHYVKRSVSACRRAVKRMIEVGLINPRQVALYRSKSYEQYQLWVEEHPGIGW